MKYLYYVYKKKANKDYSMNVGIYSKLECTQFEVVRYVEQLNKNKRLQELGYNFYFERIK